MSQEDSPESGVRADGSKNCCNLGRKSTGFLPSKSGRVIGWTQPAGEVPPGLVKMRRELALQMAAIGWSSARIGREFGVTQSVAWRFVQRHRARVCERRRPSWAWRQCSACKVFGWFKLTSYRRRGTTARRSFCSKACYQARGTDGAAGRARALNRSRVGGNGKRRSWFKAKPPE